MRMVALLSVALMLASYVASLPEEGRVRAYEITTYVDEYDDSSRIAESNWINFGGGNASLSKTEYSWTMSTSTDFSVGRFNNTIVQGGAITLSRTTQPSTATELDLIVAENVNGSGVVCTDGTYLYTKRWSSYPGNNSFAKIGTGFNGTERGKNYGFIKPDSNTSIAAAYLPDGYIYNGRTTNAGLRLERQDPITGNRSYVDLPPESGLLRRDTGTVEARTDHMITTDGRYLYCLAYKHSGSASYNGFKFIVLDPENNWSLVRTVYAGTSSYYTNGIIADGECVYPIQWVANGYAKVTRIDAVTGEILAQWTLFQKYNNTNMSDPTNNDPISGAYDWVNNRVYLGELTHGRIHEYLGKRESNIGEYTSPVHSAEQLVNWRELDYSATLTPGTNVTAQARAGSFGMTMTDNFDDAGNMSALSGSWGINNGTYNTYGGERAVAVTSLLAGIPEEDNDYGLEARMRESGTSIGAMGIAFRVQDADNCYIFHLNGSSARLIRRTNGTDLQLTAVPYTWYPDVWCELGIEALGNNLRCYINGALVISMFDARFPSGPAGFSSYGSPHEFDDARVKVMQWNNWTDISYSPVFANHAGIYGQYKLILTASASKDTPALEDTTMIMERYETEGYIVSLPFTTNKNFMTLTSHVNATVPEGTTARLRLSNDFGQTWENTTIGAFHIFSSVGMGFQYRIDLTSTGARTPTIESVSFDLESNMMPQAPQLWAPLNNTWLNTTMLELTCLPAVDPDADNLSYRFTISRNLNFTEVIDSGWVMYPNWTTPPLEDGRWFWRACANDTRLVSRESEPFSFVIDTQAPTISTPIDVGIYSTTQQVRFVWNASLDPSPNANATPSGVKGYYIKITTSPIENASNLVKSAFVEATEYRLANVVNGLTYYAKIRAIDNANNMGEWSSVSDGVIVDISLPSVSNVRPSAPRYSPSKAITWSWNASLDYPSGIAGYYVWVWTGGTDLVMDQFTTGLNFTYDNCTDGKTYYAKVRALDGAGNTGEYCTTEYGVMVDTTPPEQVTVTDSGRYTNNPGTFAFEWTKSLDPESGISRYEYCLGTSPGIDDVIEWRNATPTQQSVRYTGISLADGITYYASVRAVNGAGIRAPVSSTDGITVDTTPPMIGTVDDGGELSTVGTISFTWNATDAVSGVTSYIVSVGTENGSSNVLPMKQMTNTSLVVERAKNGVRYYINVQAVDGAGNKCVPRTSDGILVNTVRCYVITDFGGNLTKGKITVAGVSSVENASISEVHYSLDGKDWALAYGTEYWSISFDTRTLKNGNHTLRARATDGSTFSPVAEFSFAVKNKANSEEDSSVLSLVLMFVVIAFAMCAIAKVQSDRRKRANAQVIVISLEGDAPNFMPYGQYPMYQQNTQYQQLPPSYVDPYSQNVYASQYFGESVKSAPSYSGEPVVGQYYGQGAEAIPHSIPAGEDKSYSHALSVAGAPQFCMNCRGLIKPGLVAVKCVCGMVYHDICAERKKVCDCGHPLPKRSELKKLASPKKEEKKPEPDLDACPQCKGKVRKGPVVECSCGAKYHLACARDAGKCTCGKKLDPSKARELEKEKVRAAKAETCATCNGAIKQGLAITKCSCGLVHHTTCAARVGKCMCGKAI